MPGAKPYTLQNTMLHPLARMLPLQREQAQVYRLGEKNPPVGELDGHGPDWEVVSMILNAGLHFAGSSEPAARLYPHGAHGEQFLERQRGIPGAAL